MEINSLMNLRCIQNEDAYRYIGKKDFLSVLKLYLTSISYRYIYWFRLCCYLHKYSLLRPIWIIAYLYYRRLSYKSGIQIPLKTNIGHGFYIGHYGTIVINGASTIGNNVNISPGVNIGRANRGKNKGVPTIGNEVYIGPGVKIVGAVKIGNNVAIGANAVVTKDVPDNACVAGIPAKILSMKGAEGYINRTV